MSHLYAVQQVRRLRGGSQAQLLRGSDGSFYVTKSAQNPQHVRVLANEMLATRLGQVLGLPVPSVEPIEIPESLVARGELRVELAGGSMPWKPGIHLASLYVRDPSTSGVFDYLPEDLMSRVQNLDDFCRVLVLDRWTCNCDGRQAIFYRKAKRSRGFFATFIDQGYCFNAGEWSFPDSPLRGVYARNCVYATVTGWVAFEPALSRAEQMDIEQIWRIAAAIPEEWYESDHAGLCRLVESLYRRRAMIRDLITAFRTSSRNPFPNWRDS